MVRFLDPTYNEKRLWVSRLLAQFLLEGDLIISIDESNFRSDSFSKRKWTFAPKVGTVSQLLHGTQLEQEADLEPLDFAVEYESLPATEPKLLPKKRQARGLVCRPFKRPPLPKQAVVERAQAIKVESEPEMITPPLQRLSTVVASSL